MGDDCPMDVQRSFRRAGRPAGKMKEGRIFRTGRLYAVRIGGAFHQASKTLCLRNISVSVIVTN
jgi:hypothetical protein